MEKELTGFPDFRLNAQGHISQEFFKRNITTFKQAALFIAELPYGRNADKNNPVTVFSDNCGTCSTKHALLKQLANEHSRYDIKLITGLFKMNSTNTPEVARTLKKYQLSYIPEAHNYLKYNNRIFDFTKPDFGLSGVAGDLIEELEITPNQISDYKVSYHKAYLQTWLINNPQHAYTLAELWDIREQCIKDLAGVV